MPRTAAIASLAVIAIGLAGLSACAQDPTPADLATSDAERRVVTVAEARAATDVVGATDRLGLTLLGSAPLVDNAVVSPASAVIALAMLAEGARGVTADQFDAALGAAGADRTDAVNALLAALEEYAGDPAIVQDEELPEAPLLHVANQVVVDDQIEVHAAYLDALAAGYGAGVAETDLGSSTGKKLLDAWVRENTGGLIEESAIEPTDDLRLVLQNAVVLAARWATPFEPDSTRDLPFTLGSGDTVTTDTLVGTQDLAYAEADGWRAVRLPYSEGFHADVLLPPAGTDPASITAEQQAALRSELDTTTPGTVHLAMPSLDIRTEPLDLEAALVAAGLGGLFYEPDLSGISDLELELDQAFQQATLAVGEEGTIAAAVTELGIIETSAEVPEPGIDLQVDRPYLFTVAHTETSWPLFVAAIRDPRH